MALLGFVVATTTSADFSLHTLSSVSSFQTQGEISSGKNAVLPRIAVGSTSPGQLTIGASRRSSRSPHPAPPRIRFLFIGPRFRSPLPPHDRSPFRSCGSLRLRWSPFGGTCTRKTALMLSARMLGNCRSGNSLREFEPLSGRQRLPAHRPLIRAALAGRWCRPDGGQRDGIEGEEHRAGKFRLRNFPSIPGGSSEEQRRDPSALSPRLRVSASPGLSRTQRPTGCQTVLVSRKRSIQPRPCALRSSIHASGSIGTCVFTRFTLSAPSASTALRRSASTIHASMPMTSRCFAMCGRRAPSRDP